MDIKELRFNNLPQSAQILIFIAMIGCAAVAYYMYCLKDRIEESNAIQAEIINLEQSVAKKTAAEARYKQFKEAIAKSEEQLAIRQRMLPTEKETPTILRNIQQMATSSNLRIDKFIPQALIPRAYYLDWPLQLEVQGNYDGLGQFFEKISRAHRIINVGAISIKGIEQSNDSTQTLTANCTATTFVFRDNPPAKSQEIETQKEKKR
jgi:type IV pilus assembly protein PilO